MNGADDDPSRPGVCSSTIDIVVVQWGCLPSNLARSTLGRWQPTNVSGVSALVKRRVKFNSKLRCKWIREANVVHLDLWTTSQVHASWFFKFVPCSILLTEDLTSFPMFRLLGKELATSKLYNPIILLFLIMETLVRRLPLEDLIHSPNPNHILRRAFISSFRWLLINPNMLHFLEEWVQ